MKNHINKKKLISISLLIDELNMIFDLTYIYRYAMFKSPKLDINEISVVDNLLLKIEKTIDHEK